MAIGPRQQLYIVSGIAAFFAVMMILFIILFATKHCKKCDNQLVSSDVGSALVQMADNARDAGSIESAFVTAGYSVFKITPLKSANGQPIAIVNYQPPDSAQDVVKNIESKANKTVEVYNDDSASIPVCPQIPPSASTSGEVQTAATNQGQTSIPTSANPEPSSTFCPPVGSSICSSIVKDVVFVIDLLPDIQGNSKKFNQISNALSRFGQSVTFGDAATRVGIIGFDDTVNSPGLRIYNSQGSFNDGVTNLLNNIPNRPSNSWANVGSALNAIDQYNDQFRNVEKIVLIISDHAPVASDPSNGGQSITGATVLANKLRNDGFYVGALTPVPTYFTTIRVGYMNGIVSNSPLFDGNVKGYDDSNFGTEIQNFFLQNVCGYVDHPVVPPPPTSTTVTTPSTTTTTTPSTTPFTGTTTPYTGSSTSPIDTSVASSSPTTTTPPTSTTTTPATTTTFTTAPPTTTAPKQTNKCQTIDILFILDRSQSIENAFYNNDVKNFVKYIGGAFSMSGEAPLDFPNALGRTAVIQFSDEATVSVPFARRTRSEFISAIDNNVVYQKGGTTSIENALQKAVDYLGNGSTATDNLVVVIVTDGVSTQDIVDSQPVADKLRKRVHMFTGVGIPGINGNDIEANITNLALLLGNPDYAFSNITFAEDALIGILPDALKAYPCPTIACKGVIFIGEMTEVIAQERKELFLNATMQIATKINANPGGSTTNDQVKYAIALFGESIYKHIELQTFSDFQVTIDQEIKNLISNNTPNGGTTYTAPILNELAMKLNSGELKNYAVLFMGETERILDSDETIAAAKNVASAGADIFVLDMTAKDYEKDGIFNYLINNDQSRKLNYTKQSQSDLVDYYSKVFVPVFSNLTCTAPPLGTCINLFDMVLAVDQGNDNQTEQYLKSVAAFYNKAFVSSGIYGQMTQRGLVEYSVGGNPIFSEELNFNADLIANDISTNLTFNPVSSNVYNSPFSYIRKMVTRCGKTRDYAQNLVLYISSVYPTDTDEACKSLKDMITSWQQDSLAQAAYVYYVSLAPQPQNTKPCSAFDNIFTINYTDNDVINIPQLNPTVKYMCLNSPQRPDKPCTCTSPSATCSNKESFFQRFLKR